MAARKGTRQKTGPEPDRVKIADNWKDAVGRVLKKPLPDGGWPAAPKRYKARKKTAKRTAGR